MKTVILQGMGRGELNPHPIQILINYWDVRPGQMGAYLDELLKKGVQRVATFVPWQAVESDISHSLPRFLQSAAERKMGVSLIMTPEVAVHYPNSGLPKDLFNQPDYLAKHAGGGTIPTLMPPNAFALPSLCSPEFLKRYHNFLSRLDTMLADLLRSQPRLLDQVTAVMTGGFWKYYRAAIDSVRDPFDGLAGDYSSVASLLFRQRVDQFYAQREFSEPSPASANRWKTRKMEDINRLWFNQQNEDVFRIRSSQFVRKKAYQMNVEQVEMFTPEADPGFMYSQFLQLLQGNMGDFSRLAQLLDSACVRASQVGDLASVPVVHWSGLGAFHKLSDSEKQFLILKSLLLTGGRGGYLLISEEEWFGLSPSFRARAESLARLIEQGELTLPNRAVYLAPQLWSNPGTLWKEFSARVGNGARLVSSLDLVQSDRDVSCIVVDPQTIMTRELVLRLMAIARAGRLVMFPRSSLYSESARMELEQTLVGLNHLDLKTGVNYQLFPIGEGKAVLYDLPENVAPAEQAIQWRTFLGATLSVAGLDIPCNLSDGRLNVLAMEKRGGGLGLFILNPTARAVSADLIFAVETTVSDLTLSIAPETTSASAEPVAPSTRFSLEVPPCGILPVAADGLSAELEERRVASTTSELMKSHMHQAAVGELAGFDQDEDLSTLWS